MSAIEPILNAYREGYGALLAGGRSLYDFVNDGGRIRPLIEALRRALFHEFGMVFLSYSIANGLNSFEKWITSKEDRQTVRDALKKSGLTDIPKDDREIVSIVRATAALMRSNSEELKWQDGRKMRIAFAFEFTEHFVPCSVAGSQSDSQLAVIELVHIMSQSLALRDSGNLLIFHGRPEYIDELIRGGLRNIRLPQPSKDEKQEFVSVALDLYDEALFEDGLGAEGIVALSVNTPNRSLENLLRASHRSGRPLTSKEIAEQKNRDVEQLSEGTLVPLDTRRVAGLNLVGRNIEIPQAVLRRFSNGLLKGDSSMAANVLLTGAPGTAKTDLAIQVAHQGQVPAYQMLSPKGGIVGETERKARLQQQALREWEPNVAFCDEVTESFPLERGEFNGDSGASRAVTAELLSSLSDETRRGRSLLIATTNRIWAMGAAMRSRFVVIPVLFPLREDFQAIIASTAERITPGCDLPIDDQKMVEAADIFYSKGANPRHIRSALSNTLLISERNVIDVRIVLFAAHDLCPPSDFYSSIYADLQAIRHTTSRSFLPWNGQRPDQYRFPEYLKGIVDETNGDINERALDRKIEELREGANV